MALVVVCSMVPAPLMAAPKRKKQKNSQKAKAEADQQKIAELFEQGSQAREAGAFIDAANYFHEAYVLLPVESVEARASMMLMEVEALRSAHNLDEQPTHLCAAERAVAAYIEEVKLNFGDADDIPRDVQKASEVRETLRKELDALAPAGEVFDCENPEHLARTSALEQQPAEVDPPKDEMSLADRRKLQLAGGITTGAGILGLGLLATGLVIGWRAERAGDARINMAQQQGITLPPEDPELASITKRGRSGNILAVVGAGVAVVGLAAGIPMLVIGTRPRKHVAGIYPILTRRTHGLAVHIAF